MGRVIVNSKDIKKRLSTLFSLFLFKGRADTGDFPPVRLRPRPQPEYRYFPAAPPHSRQCEA